MMIEQSMPSGSYPAGTTVIILMMCGNLGRRMEGLKVGGFEGWLKVIRL